MPDELETILRLVADGTLSPEEAAPIIEALTRAEHEVHMHRQDEHLGRHAARLDRHLGRAQRRIDRALARAAGTGRARSAAVSCASRSRSAGASA